MWRCKRVDSNFIEDIHMFLRNFNKVIYIRQPPFFDSWKQMFDCQSWTRTREAKLIHKHMVWFSRASLLREVFFKLLKTLRKKNGFFYAFFYEKKSIKKKCIYLMPLGILEIVISSWFVENTFILQPPFVDALYNLKVASNSPGGISRGWVGVRNILRV